MDMAELCGAFLTAGFVSLAIPVMFFTVLTHVSNATFLRGFLDYVQSVCWCETTGVLLSGPQRRAAQDAVAVVSGHLQASKGLTQTAAQFKAENHRTTVKGLAVGLIANAALVTLGVATWLLAGRGFSLVRAFEHALLDALIYAVVELGTLMLLQASILMDTVRIDKQALAYLVKEADLQQQQRMGQVGQ